MSSVRAAAGIAGCMGLVALLVVSAPTAADARPQEPAAVYVLSPLELSAAPPTASTSTRACGALDLTTAAGHSRVVARKVRTRVASCRAARSIIRGFYRQEIGSSGATLVRGYGCAYRRSSRVSCSKGRARVSWREQLSRTGATSTGHRRRRGTYVFNGRRGAKKPITLGVGHMTSPRTGLRAYDETSIVARGLKWRRWGKRKAVGRGRIRYCVAEYHPCRTYRGRVELARRTPDFEVPGLYTYDRVRFVIPGNIRTPWLVPWNA